MNTVLITGGAGYIGSFVNKKLTKEGYKTVVLDNLSRGHEEFVKWGKLYVGDIRDRELVKSIISNNGIISVVHLAAYAYVNESIERPGAYWENNFAKTLNFIQECADCSVLEFVYSSTCAVYGTPTGRLIKEDDCPRPINPYGVSKYAAELALRDIAASSGMNYFILRYFNATGGDLDLEIGERHHPEPHLLPNILRAAYNSGSQLDVYGDDYDTPDGSCVRDFVHVVDLADGHARALDYLYANRKSQTCNLGSGTGLSVFQIVRAVERVTGARIILNVTKRRAGDPPILVADISAASKILGWFPTSSTIDNIVKTAWQWHQKDWKNNERRRNVLSGGASI